MQSNTRNIYQQIEATIKDKNLTATTLANSLDAPVSSVSRILSGSAKRSQIILAIIDYLGIREDLNEQQTNFVKSLEGRTDFSLPLLARSVADAILETVDTLSERLLALRKESGLTQSDIAFLINAKKPTVSKLENQFVDSYNYSIFSKLYGVPAHRLLVPHTDTNAFYAEDINAFLHARMPENTRSFVQTCRLWFGYDRTQFSKEYDVPFNAIKAAENNNKVSKKLLNALRSAGVHENWLQYLVAFTQGVEPKPIPGPVTAVASGTASNIEPTNDPQASAIPMGEVITPLSGDAALTGKPSGWQVTDQPAGGAVPVASFAAGVQGTGQPSTRSTPARNRKPAIRLVDNEYKHLVDMRDDMLGYLTNCFSMSLDEILQSGASFTDQEKTALMAASVSAGALAHLSAAVMKLNSFVTAFYKETESQLAATHEKLANAVNIEAHTIQHDPQTGAYQVAMYEATIIDPSSMTVSAAPAGYMNQTTPSDDSLMIKIAGGNSQFINFLNQGDIITVDLSGQPKLDSRVIAQTKNNQFLVGYFVSATDKEVVLTLTDGDQSFPIDDIIRIHNITNITMG